MIALPVFLGLLILRGFNGRLQPVVSDRQETSAGQQVNKLQV